MFKRILRPRVLIYSTVLAVLVVGLLTSLWYRTGFKVDIIRDRSVMARLVEGGMLENVYRLQIMNATEEMQQYRLDVSGIEGLQIGLGKTKTNKLITVDPAEARWVVVHALVPDGSLKPGSHEIEFEIQSMGSKETLKEESKFLVPR